MCVFSPGSRSRTDCSAADTVLRIWFLGPRSVLCSWVMFIALHIVGHHHSVYQACFDDKLKIQPVDFWACCPSTSPNGAAHLGEGLGHCPPGPPPRAIAHPKRNNSWFVRVRHCSGNHSAIGLRHSTRRMLVIGLYALHSPVCPAIFLHR